MEGDAHKKHDVDGTAGSHDNAHGARAVRYVCNDFLREDVLHQELEGEAAAVNPRPRQPAPPQVMPQTDEGEYNPHTPSLAAAATKRHIDVP
jgi:hypothetical protein